MKKSLISIFLILICYFGYGQSNPYPINQNIGGPTTAVKTPASGAFYGGIIPYAFADTTAASAALVYMKTYPGSLVYTSSPRALWWRDAAVSQWVQVLPSGGSTGTLAWVMGGNNPVVSDGSGNAILGAQTNNGVALMTNNTQRIILPAAGLAFNQLVSDTTANKVMTFNPSTKAWGYGYWYGGGSGSTPTWQETLTAGSILSGDNTVDQDGNEFHWVSRAGTFFEEGSPVVIGGSNVSGNDSNLTVVNGAWVKRGVRFSGLTNSAARYVVHIDVNGNLSYADTTATSIPTWQETLTAGSTLTGNNNINGGGYGFAFTNYSSAQFISNGGYTNIGSDNTNIFTYADSIKILPNGKFYIDNLPNDVGTHALRYNPSTGLVSYADTTSSGGSGANTALSNLASVAVNTSIIPGTTNSIALGTTAKIWSDVQSDYFHTGALNGTYSGYSGAQLGGVSTHAVLDFVDNNSRVGEFYTDASNFNFFTDAGIGIVFYVNNSFGAPAMQFSSAGALRLGYLGAGALTADASGNITSVSDLRLKNIQGQYEVGLNQVMKINPIVYKWKPETKLDSVNNYIGFAAQNIEAALGENAIGVNHDGYKSIQDRAILAAMVNSIKQLKDLNDEQQIEIDNLKKEVKKLKKN